MCVFPRLMFGRQQMQPLYKYKQGKTHLSTRNTKAVALEDNLRVSGLHLTSARPHTRPWEQWLVENFFPLLGPLFFVLDHPLQPQRVTIARPPKPGGKFCADSISNIHFQTHESARLPVVKLCLPGQGQ